VTLYMLDTNIVSFAFRNRPPGVAERLRALVPSQVCISAITLAELRFGAARSPARRRYDGLIDTFIGRVAVCPFDEAATVSYGEVRAALQARGTPLGDLDMLIGGHALALGAVLVTNNTREFKRIEGLPVEDWTRQV